MLLTILATKTVLKASPAAFASLWGSPEKSTVKRHPKTNHIMANAANWVCLSFYQVEKAEQL